MSSDRIEHQPRGARAGFACLAAVSCAASLWAAPLSIASTWRTHDIHIDGVNSEWASLDELEKGPAVAFANDDTFLYVIVAASDPEMRRLLSTGLILWFDPTNEKKETFAIGLLGTTSPTQAAQSADGAAPPDTAVEPDSSPMDQFDIYGPGKNQRRLVRMDPALDIEMASSVQQGTYAYELKLPLTKTDTHLYAVGAKPGATIGVGIATPEAATMPSGRSGGGMSGGMGGMGGFGGMGMGRGGRGGGMRGGGSRDRSNDVRLKPIKIWTTVRLAAPPTH